MAETYASIVAGCQAELADYDAQLYTSSLLLRAINLALEEVRLELTGVGDAALRKDASITLPALTLEVGRTTTPALPADFGAPLKLLERPSGSTSPSQWSSVRLVDDIDLSVDKGEVLGVFAYQDGKLEFRGATTARELRLDYLADIPDFVAGSDPLPFPLILMPLVFLTCSHVVRAESQQASDAFRRDAERALSRVRAIGNHHKQMVIALRSARRGRVGRVRFRPLIQ